jgi:hypothetical protein
MWQSIRTGLLAIVCLTGCNGMQSNTPSVYREGVTTPSGEPAYITVQHCLIAFEGSVPGKVIVRSESEAEKLAQELFANAQAGEDFGAIVASHTDDSPPGIYQMANEGFPGDMTSSNPKQYRLCAQRHGAGLRQHRLSFESRRNRPRPLSQDR